MMSSPSSMSWFHRLPEPCLASQGGRDELLRGHGAAAPRVPPPDVDPSGPGPARAGPRGDLRGPGAGANRGTGPERGVSPGSRAARPQHVLLVLWLHAA